MSSLVRLWSSIVALFRPQTMKEFDWTTANTAVWLSAAAYCEADTYLNRSYKGASGGFIPKYVIDISEYDVQGIIGVMSSQNALYIAFRGTHTLPDWENDFDLIFTNYDWCTNCQVQAGFYDAEQQAIDYVKNKTSLVVEEYQLTSIVVTGHSLGAAIATLTALDLLHSGYKHVRMVNFGSPRVGNEEFAMYASNHLPDHIRITHYRDMVPHMPWHRRWMHISNEWYEDEDHCLHQCLGYEDPLCSYQWWYLTIEDHMIYLSVPLLCEAVSS